MTGGLLMLMALQSTAAFSAIPGDDAVARYNLCVSRMAHARAGNDPADATAYVSAIACENLLGAAVEQFMNAASGTPEEARRRVATLLELQARREAVARNSIIKSYEVEKQ